MRFLITFCILAIAFESIGQGVLPEEKVQIIEERVDFLLESNEGGDNDYTSLFEQLEYYFEHPLNLNSASRIDLLDLGIFNEIQINNLFNHINKHGKIMTVEELQSIDGFNLDFIRLIRPFVKVSSNIDRPNLNPKTILEEGSSSYFIRYTRVLEEQFGYSAISEEEYLENPNSRYLGSQDKLFSRYRFNYANNVSFGFTTEKDAGEEFFKGSQKNGFDFYSAHLYLQGLGTVNRIAIGDFQAQFGQGLTFWSGLAFGRTPDIFTLKRNAPKLRPYTSVQEDLFLRGAGVSVVYKSLEFTTFFSSHNVDGNVIGTDTLTNEDIVSTLTEDGFHRTPNELMNKNNIENRFIGGNLEFRQRNLSIGLTAVHNEIDANFSPQSRTYNQFDRLDNENSNFGIDYSYLYKNANFFGEISKSVDGGYAMTNGALIVLNQNLSLAIQHRRFERDFRPIQSNAIGESSNNSNERATFIGINTSPIKHFTISAFVDRFEYDWLRFQTDGPSHGFRYLFQLTYKPKKAFETYFRFRQRTRDRNSTTTESGIDELLVENLNNYRFHLSYQITKSIKLKSRIEFSNYQLGDLNDERGFLIYQDINYKQLSVPLSFSIRYAIFDTESFNSRIYAYENDVLYAFSVPAFNGRGSRFYITTKYHVNRNIDLWLRYANTYFADRTEIGSGKERINGNTRNEIKAQLRIKF